MFAKNKHDRIKMKSWEREVTRDQTNIKNLKKMFEGFCDFKENI